MIQMKNLRYLAVAIGLATCCSMMAAENDSPKAVKWYDFEYEVNAGTNIGGATPLPLPAEIRHIGAFNPSLDLQIGGSITKWIDPAARWGVSLGVRLETKGMETRAGVKDYGMEIWQDGEMLNGRWTGQVKTRYSTQQLVIPVTGVWKANHRLRVNFGPYMAFAFKSHFDGRVYDGYLRVGNPTGDKVDKLLRGMIDDRLKRGQFDNCDITMKDLTAIRLAIVGAYGGLFHKRIKYDIRRGGINV